VTTTYSPLPGGPDHATYSARLATCATCRHRTATQCRPAQQLTSILARLPNGRCPAGLWPDQPLNDFSPPAPAAADGRVSVAVICHNQAEYLAEALRSVRNQTAAPASIVVIDAASTDHTREIAAAFAPYGIQYLRTDSHNLARARMLAYQHTRGEFLLTLDADDLLGPTYLADGLAALATDPAAGIAWTDLTQFGDKSGPLRLTAGDPNRSNWIHSGAIVRRAALDQLEERDAWPTDWNPLAHHDWRLWRCVLRNGWTAVKSPAAYHYRRHSASLTARQTAEKTPWPILADLAHEPIQLFIPASGRWTLLDRLPRLLETTATAHSGRLSLALAVTTADPIFLRDLERLAADAVTAGNLAGYTLYRHDVGPEHLADQNRHSPDTYRAVQIAMSRLYARALRDTTAEYLWILEDDIGPPADALATMLAGFDAAVASVALPYRSRFHPSFVAWDHTGQPYRQPPAAGLAPVGGNGFGCCVLRRSFFRHFPIRSDRSGNYDPEFYADLRRRGGVALVDWSAPCTHG
jgi:hypothetical protein